MAEETEASTSAGFREGVNIKLFEGLEKEYGSGSFRDASRAGKLGDFVGIIITADPVRAFESAIAKVSEGTSVVIGLTRETEVARQTLLALLYKSEAAGELRVTDDRPGRPISVEPAAREKSSESGAGQAAGEADVRAAVEPAATPVPEGRVLSDPAAIARAKALRARIADEIEHMPDLLGASKLSSPQL